MALNRIGNLAVFKNTFRNVASVQGDLAGLQKQISSGIKSDNFRGLSGQVEQFTFLENRLRNSKLYQDNNVITLARLRTVEQSTAQIVEVADQIEDLILLRRNGATGSALNFTPQIKNLATAAANEMNVRLEGRYLFSGASTEVPPISNPFTPQAEFGVADDAFYQGSKVSVVYKTDDRINFDFPARGDDPAFQKLFTAVNIAIKADITNDDEGFARALDMVKDAQEDLNTLRSSVNSNVIILEQITARHKTTELYLKGVTEEVSKTDLLSASTELANNQAVLQASFQAFARISQLRLSDFLR